MEQLPSCISGTYSNDIDVQNLCLFNCLIKYIGRYMRHHRRFFVGLCYYCDKAESESDRLICCPGCELVGYCNKACQEMDWYAGHVHVCKEFPVVNGKNALYTGEASWEEHIGSLRERAGKLPNAEQQLLAEPLFRNPRVCNTCQESSVDLLVDCKCHSVSYCSLSCEKADNSSHMVYCNALTQIAQSHSLQLKYLRIGEDTVSETFTLTSKWSDLILRQHSLDLLKSIAKDKSLGVKYSLALERLSYPMSLLYALQTLPERCLGYDQSLPIEELTTLAVHVVTSSPLFDSRPWEIFMHRLPKLKQLNVVFIIQGRPFKDPFTLNFYGMGLRRCEDCEDKNRLITYSVHQMLYHMFFSSPDYTEPDVVIVYGNTDEMFRYGESNIHREISYRNMTYSRDTVLVLTDATEVLVNLGVRAVNAAQPVHQLVSTQINPLRGFSSNRPDMGADIAVINEKHFLSCLRRK